jgi:hypothetical protein
MTVSGGWGRAIGTFCERAPGGAAFGSWGRAVACWDRPAAHGVSRARCRALTATTARAERRTICTIVERSERRQPKRSGGWRRQTRRQPPGRSGGLLARLLSEASDASRSGAEDGGDRHGDRYGPYGLWRWFLTEGGILAGRRTQVLPIGADQFAQVGELIAQAEGEFHGGSGDKVRSNSSGSS